MRYEDFKLSWAAALQESGLPTFGFARETLDPCSLERRFEQRVSPIGGQPLEPFTVTALLSWRWSTLHTARAVTTEEDMLTSLFGRDECAEATELPWLRVDIELCAGVHHGAKLAMPSQKTWAAWAAWAAWALEAVGRMEDIEPLIPEKSTRERDDGRLDVLAWLDAPLVEVACQPDGILLLNRVKLSAWQAIEVPRTLDDPDRYDDDPGDALLKMFERVRAALHGWGEVMDHLVRR